MTKIEKKVGRKMLYTEPLDTVSFTLPRFLVARLDALAAARQDSRSRVLRAILDATFSAEPEPRPTP